MARRGHAQGRERWAVGFSIAGLVVLSFLAGTAVAGFEVFPYPHFLGPVYASLRAQLEQAEVFESVIRANIWAKARDGGSFTIPYDPARPFDVGAFPAEAFAASPVRRHNPAKAFAGYTLLTSAYPGGALLVDMDGRVVHRWYLPFREVWPAPPHVRTPVPEPYIYWRRVHLFPNGDLLVVLEGNGSTPYGYGLIKVDRDSRVLWAYAGMTHHDFTVHTDGTIYAIAHAFRDTRSHPVPGAAQYPKRVLEDFVVVLSPDGQELRRVNVLDAFARSPFRALLQTEPLEPWDVIHTNSIKVIGPAFAAHHPFAQPGHVLITSLALNANALLDMEREQIVWASTGFWSYPHDPDPLDNGHMLIFDNHGHRGLGGESRVVEFDPATNAIAWVFAGRPDAFFHSTLRASQQPLPNGNVLITESEGGRLLEVARDGEIVWEFVHPVRLAPVASPGSLYTPVVCSGVRVPASALAFEPRWAPDRQPGGGDPSLTPPRG